MNRPGWYADPLGENDLRLWDGSRWTTRVRARRQPADVRSASTPLWWTAAVAVGALVLLLVVLFVVSTSGTGIRPSLGSNSSATQEAPATTAIEPALTPSTGVP